MVWCYPSRLSRIPGTGRAGTCVAMPRALSLPTHTWACVPRAGLSLWPRRDICGTPARSVLAVVRQSASDTACPPPRAHQFGAPSSSKTDPQAICARLALAVSCLPIFFSYVQGARRVIGAHPHSEHSIESSSSHNSSSRRSPRAPGRRMEAPRASRWRQHTMAKAPCVRLRKMWTYHTPAA